MTTITAADVANLVPGMAVREYWTDEQIESFAAVWGDVLDAGQNPAKMTVSHMVKHASGDGWTIYGQGDIGCLRVKADTLIEVI